MRCEVPAGRRRRAPQGGQCGWSRPPGPGLPFGTAPPARGASASAPGVRPRVRLLIGDWS
eukprot:1194861-Prorocentrum_minimum.AAC.5